MQTAMFDPSDSHRCRAEAWIEGSPYAMSLFESLALKAAGPNFDRKFGIGLLTERVRWEFSVERRDDEFKVNNNHRAYIARELIRRHPRLAKCIVTRTVHS